jgi:hypothetical protein
MALLLDGLLLFVIMVAWGAQAMVPWWLAQSGQAEQQPAAGKRAGAWWRIGSVPLALAGLMAALALASRNPDAAVARHLVPILATVPGTLLAIGFPALLVAALIASLGGQRLDRLGWRMVAGFGLATCAAAGWAGELLRIGEGPASPPPGLALLVACRLALTLAAGGLLVPGRPGGAIAGGLAMLAYLPLLPPELRHDLGSQGILLTCGAAALLLLAVRWLPPALRRIALAAGVLLAALVLAQAGRTSQDLPPTVEPVPLAGSPGR